MAEEPLGCEASWLPAIEGIPDDIWCQKGQFDQLLDTTFRHAFALGDLTKCLSGQDLIKVTMGTCNVPVQSFVARGSCILKDQLGFNATFSMLEFGSNAEKFLGDFIALDMQQRGNAFPSVARSSIAFA